MSVKNVLYENFSDLMVTILANKILQNNLTYHMQVIFCGTLLAIFYM